MYSTAAPQADYWMTAPDRLGADGGIATGKLIGEQLACYKHPRTGFVHTGRRLVRAVPWAAYHG